MPKPDLPPSPSNVGRLPPPEWERLQDLADRFENAWKAAGPEVDTVGLVGFLPAAGDPLRSLALGELIRTELEIRWRRGQFVLLEHYLEQFPELGAPRDLSPRLIYEEYRIRRLHGDQPDVTAYEKRFPGQYPEVQRLIQGSPTLFSPPPPGGAVTPSGPIPTPSLPSALRAVPLSSDVLSVGGGFRLIKRIGAGGFGEVWRAEAPGGVEVALKILSRPIDHAEAQRELESLELVKKLRHPLLLQIHAYWVLEDRLVIAMELADGSLRDRLKVCPDGVPMAELVRYFVQTAEALDFLHQQGVQHRDVKPDNILLVQRHVKVADFGLARRQGDQSMTASGSGSPPYMAPEVWRGKVTPHSDQYSLAVTYAELRLGRRPFSGREFFEMMLDHTERPPNLDPLPAAEQLVLQRALDKDPAKRFRTCADFVDELVRVTVTPALTPAPPTRTPPPDPATRIPENDPAALGSLMPTPASGNSPRPTDVRLQPDWRARPSPRGRLPMGCWLAAVAGALGIAAASPWLGPWLVSIINPRPGPPTDISTWIEPQVQLPAGTKWRAFDKTTRRVPDGRTLYQTLAKDVPGLSEPVVFRLVAGPTEDALVPPFYMMENKVSNLLFRVVAEDKVYQAFAQKEKARVAETVRHKWNENPEGIAGSKRDMLPVLNVTVVEAYCFAKSMGDECDLPTVEEWDKAAGCRDGHEGPYNPEEVAYIADAQHALKGTRADQPMSVNRTPVEMSWSGCRDMAGNGCEWTRTPDKPVRDFPVESPPPGLMIYVCGRSYASELARPFRCRDDAEGLPLSYREPSPHVSFRVVARIPRSQP